MTQLARTDQETPPQPLGSELSRPGVGLLAAVGAAHLVGCFRECSARLS
jgi:hypothetical protein